MIAKVRIKDDHGLHASKRNLVDQKGITSAELNGVEFGSFVRLRVDGIEGVWQRWRHATTLAFSPADESAKANLQKLRARKLEQFVDIEFVGPADNFVVPPRRLEGRRPKDLSNAETPKRFSEPVGPHHIDSGSRVKRVEPTMKPGEPLPTLPDDIVHADWGDGSRYRKRQVVWARRCGQTYVLSAPREARPTLMEDLVRRARAGRAVMAGFDFVVGLPVAYASAASKASASEGVDLGADFLSMVRRLPATFFDPVDEPGQVSWRSPFFPVSGKGWGRLKDLMPEGGLQDWLARRILGDVAKSRADLLREAERPRGGRGQATPLFVLQLPSQVGKASLSGWKELIIPGLAEYPDVAKIWPFHGRLEDLMRPGKLILVETYPAECYLHFGIGNKAKQDRDWRREAARMISEAAQSRGVVLGKKLVASIEDGFGEGVDGEDPFDAFAGAAMMVLLALGKDSASEPNDSSQTRWEGWILGSEH